MALITQAVTITLYIFISECSGKTSKTCFFAFMGHTCLFFKYTLLFYSPLYLSVFVKRKPVFFHCFSHFKFSLLTCFRSFISPWRLISVRLSRPFFIYLFIYFFQAWDIWRFRLCCFLTLFQSLCGCVGFQVRRSLPPERRPPCVSIPALPATLIIDFFFSFFFGTGQCIWCY